MIKIKILGLLVLLLSILLAVLFHFVSQNNIRHHKILDTINEQKSFTQEISKNVFYIYRNKDTSCSHLDESINKFVTLINSRNKELTQVTYLDIKEENEIILKLWNEFYLSVENFKNNTKVDTPYSSVILEDIVQKVYATNLKLVIEFNKLISLHQKHFDERHENNKKIQYALFSLFFLLLLYMFTQIKVIFSFIQKFLTTSKNIITSSSVKDLEFIEIKQNSDEILEATNNFNSLVKNINESIEFSSKSIENSYKSLEHCENNIEELFEFISKMQDNKKIDNDFIKKEDTLIASLEELSLSALNLKNLKKDLDSLISHKKV